MNINRRQSIFGVASALCSALVTTPAMAAGIGRISGLQRDASVESHDMHPLEKFMRIRSSRIGKPTYWWYSGHVMGYVDGDSPLQPILSVVGASQSIAARNSDGSVHYDMVEAGYYGDPTNGCIADSPIVNRLTGERINPKHYLSRQQLRFDLDLTVQPASGPLPTDVSFEGRIIGPDEKGDRIWMGENIIAEIAARDGRPKRIANSLAKFQASLSDVLSNREFVPASFDYTTLNSFRPWMNMGTRTGRIMSRLQALKLESWNSVPLKLRGRIETDHPGVFGNA